MFSKLTATTLLLLFTSLSFLQAQSSNFLSLTQQPQNLSQGQLTFVSNIATQSITKEMHYVKYGQLRNMLDTAGRLDLMLPGVNTTHSCDQVKYKITDADNYTYMGKIDSESGYLAIKLYKGYLAGFIHTNSHYWELIPLTNEVSILREHDKAGYPNDVCPPSISSTSPPVVDCDNNTNCEGGIIDVLILTSPDVATWYGTTFNNFEAQFAHLLGSLMSFEFALINSNVNNVEMRYHLLPNVAFPYSSPLDIIQDRDELGLVFGPPLRNAYKADLVVLFTAMDYLGFAGASDGDNGFAIVEVQSMLGTNIVLAHELGHNFRADHNESNNVPCNSNCGNDFQGCDHGWRFTDGGMDRTIMSMLFDTHIANGSSRTLHFSNPDVSFDGFPTSNGNDENNSKVISDRACWVKNYRSSPYFEVKMASLDPICSESGDFFTYLIINEAASVYLGHPPYTYEWQVSGCGAAINEFPVPPLGSANISFDCNGGNVIVSATVTSSDGQVQTASTSVNILPSPCFGGGGGGGANTYADQEENNNPESNKDLSSVQIFPNPFHNNFEFILPSDYKKNFEYSIIDTKGITVISKRQLNTNTQLVNLKNLSSGVYFIRMQDETKTIIRKILKQ